MTVDDESLTASTLSPGEAFGALGNETRLQILRALREADGPLSFSALRDRVGMRDSGQFSYHLRKLEGHFVAKTDDGYALRGPGGRVIEAILSGVVTDSPVLHRTPIDERCPYCDAPVEARYHQERLELFCTACEGTWGDEENSAPGYLGFYALPPSGLRGRTPDEVTRAAWTFQNRDLLAVSCGSCPRCAGTLERDVDVCAGHDAADGLCDRCHRRRAVQFRFRCENCSFQGQSTVGVPLAGTTELLSFLTDHGINPLAPQRITPIERVHSGFEEDVVSTDPFEARVTFTLDGDTLTLTVDDDLTVTDATRSR